MAKPKILVVDDDPDIRDVLKLTLEGEGYDVEEATNGKEALALIQKVNPHLILLDFKMPLMDGGQVSRALKKDVLLAHLPIIMLTSRGEVIDKVHGIEAGVDDYITKPFDPAELLARVKMILRRTARSLDANPLSKLPGNVSILEELQARLDSEKPLATCYIDLDKFKAFNDRYGFERGDGVIKTTARILMLSMRQLGNQDDFLGHIGGDDFVLLTTPAKVNTICKRIIDEFIRSVPSFYDIQDKTSGFIEAKDRDGQTKRFPLLTISIAVVTNDQRSIKHVAEVAQIGAELKEQAKEKGGNLWIKDRRGD